MHIVEIRHIGTDLDVAQTELKTWLDSHSIRPVEFEHSTGGPGITFRVHFAAKEDAAAFCETFHGWLNNAQGRHECRWASASDKPAA
jgi:hypothetical protein